jgi:hypothetical protein
LGNLEINCLGLFRQDSLIVAEILPKDNYEFVIFN